MAVDTIAPSVVCACGAVLNVEANTSALPWFDRIIVCNACWRCLYLRFGPNGEMMVL